MLRNNTKRVVLVVQTRENNAFCDVSRGRARLPGPKSIKESYSTTRFVWKNIDFMVFSAHDTRQNARFGRENTSKQYKTHSFGRANPCKSCVSRCFANESKTHLRKTKATPPQGKHKDSVWKKAAPLSGKHKEFCMETGTPCSGEHNGAVWK